jgi:hypothetical protein
MNYCKGINIHCFSLKKRLFILHMKYLSKKKSLSLHNSMTFAIFVEIWNGVDFLSFAKSCPEVIAFK